MQARCGNEHPLARVSMQSPGSLRTCSAGVDGHAAEELQARCRTGGRDITSSKPPGARVANVHRPASGRRRAWRDPRAPIGTVRFHRRCPDQPDPPVQTLDPGRPVDDEGRPVRRSGAGPGNGLPKLAAEPGGGPVAVDVRVGGGRREAHRVRLSRARRADTGRSRVATSASESRTATPFTNQPR